MTEATISQIGQRMRLLTGCVNVLPMFDKAAGTLLFYQFQIDQTGIVRVLLLHRPRGWNNWKAPDGKYYPARSVKGELLHPLARFPAAEWLRYEVGEDA